MLAEVPAPTAFRASPLSALGGTGGIGVTSPVGLSTFGSDGAQPLGKMLTSATTGARIRAARNRISGHSHDRAQTPGCHQPCRATPRSASGRSAMSERTVEQIAERNLDDSPDGTRNDCEFGLAGIKPFYSRRNPPIQVVCAKIFPLRFFVNAASSCEIRFRTVLRVAKGLDRRFEFCCDALMWQV
jgi:hypothetical protein